MRLERRDGYWLLVGWAAPGAAATTIGSVILVRRACADDDHLLRHELVHVEQWRRYGFLGFSVRYLVPYFRARFRGYPHWAAYRRIPFEIEAEWRARCTDPGG